MGSQSHSLVFSTCVSPRRCLFWNFPQAVELMRETVWPEEPTMWDWAVDLQSCVGKGKTSPGFLRCEGQPDNKNTEKAGDGRFWTAVYLPSKFPIQPCVSDVHGPGWSLWLQLVSEPWEPFWVDSPKSSSKPWVSWAQGCRHWLGNDLCCSACVSLAQMWNHTHKRDWIKI